MNDRSAQLLPNFHRVRIGGLTRCCLDTLRHRVAADASPKEGETLQCRHTSDPEHQMIYREGFWQWDMDEGR